tara:strand:+ start:352 stop:678 length:327 start_codon:yes stop_codon:yes gene_type:complete
MIDNYSNVDTHEVKETWFSLSFNQKKDAITDFLKKNSYDHILKFSNITTDGQVNFQLLLDIDVNTRCDTLLDIELHMKSELDIGLTLWLDPMGDKNTLRNLRGIEIVK